ncbi:hypothetical protein NEDG_01583 [Nematocida displodere]|uniref:Uncharacterized protein n=1 Tax=Nematocida displodere TaxID=1805483 RepID=A0A177EIE9_9MICR|nr:hypothetical protein NEDG_01583 [Nematocida displodere]
MFRYVQTYKIACLLVLAVARVIATSPDATTALTPQTQPMDELASVNQLFTNTISSIKQAQLKEDLKHSQFFLSFYSVAEAFQISQMQSPPCPWFTVYSKCPAGDHAIVEQLLSNIEGFLSLYEQEAVPTSPEQTDRRKELVSLFREKYTQLLRSEEWVGERTTMATLFDLFEGVLALARGLHNADAKGMLLLVCLRNKSYSVYLEDQKRKSIANQCIVFQTALIAVVPSHADYLVLVDIQFTEDDLLSAHQQRFCETRLSVDIPVFRMNNVSVPAMGYFLSSIDFRSGVALIIHNTAISDFSFLSYFSSAGVTDFILDDITDNRLSAESVAACNNSLEHLYTTVSKVESNLHAPVWIFGLVVKGVSLSSMVGLCISDLTIPLLPLAISGDRVVAFFLKNSINHLKLMFRADVVQTERATKLAIAWAFIHTPGIDSLDVFFQNIQSRIRKNHYLSLLKTAFPGILSLFVNGQVVWVVDP